MFKHEVTNVDPESINDPWQSETLQMSRCAASAKRKATLAATLELGDAQQLNFLPHHGVNCKMTFLQASGRGVSILVVRVERHATVHVL